MSSDEGVGYKRPPKTGQFKPGQSGNPRGRPKGASLKSDLASEMREQITLRDENGRPHTVTKQRALIQKLLASALQNERGAMSALFACMRLVGVGEEEAATEATDSEDFEMIKDYVKRTEDRLRSEKASKDSNKSQKSTAT